MGNVSVVDFQDVKVVGELPIRFKETLSKLEEFILGLEYSCLCIEEDSKFRVVYKKHPLWERFILSFFLDETLLLRVSSSKTQPLGYKTLYCGDLKVSDKYYIWNLWDEIFETLDFEYDLKKAYHMVVEEHAIKVSFTDGTEKLLVEGFELLPQSIENYISVDEYAYSGLLEVLQKFLASNKWGINLSSPEVLGLGSEPYSFTLVLDFDLSSPHTRLLVSRGEEVLFIIFLANGSISLNKGDSPLLYSLDDELLLELNSYIKTSLDYISNNSDLIWNVAYVKFNLENALVLDRFGIANIFEVIGVN